MTKKNKILIGILAFLSVIGIEMAIGGYVYSRFFLNGHLKGKFEAKSVSPNGRWKIRIFTVEHGAYASDRYYLVVDDQKGAVPVREIDFEGTRFKTGSDELRWKSNDTLTYCGQETNVRTGTVLLGTSVSPGHRWRITVYNVFPIGQRYGRTFAKVVDLKGEISIRKVILKQEEILEDHIRWKSANVVDVYGQVLNLHKLRQGSPSE